MCLSVLSLFLLTSHPGISWVGVQDPCSLFALPFFSVLPVGRMAQHRPLIPTSGKEGEGKESPLRLQAAVCWEMSDSGVPHGAGGGRCLLSPISMVQIPQCGQRGEIPTGQAGPGLPRPRADLRAPPKLVPHHFCPHPTGQSADSRPHPAVEHRGAPGD